MDKCDRSIEIDNISYIFLNMKKQKYYHRNRVYLPKEKEKEKKTRKISYSLFSAGSLFSCKRCIFFTPM